MRMSYSKLDVVEFCIQNHKLIPQGLLTSSHFRQQEPNKLLELRMSGTLLI